jgi:hypothetical protein
MAPRDDQFTPKGIDEQIERLLEPPSQAVPSASASARLIRQLRRLYRQQATDQRERSLARAWQRIAREPVPRGAAASNHVDQRAALPLAALRQETGQPTPEATRPSSLPTSHTGVSTMTTKRVRGLAAFVTLVAVVALFVLLFSTILPKHPNKPTFGSSGTPQPSVSATTTTIPLPGGQWVSSLSGNISQGDAPMLFPGNPRILYQDQANNGDNSISLRRSDDGGATWHPLAPPTGLPSAFDETSLFVSPFDPNVVFLTLAAYQGLHPEACQLATASSSPLARLSGGPTCGAHYISTDGGQQWSKQTLPIAGALGAPYGGHLQNPTSDEILRPQGQRLYSTISASTIKNVTFLGPGARIVASDDGGVTWKLVDGDLHASGQNTCDYAPTPTGSTIFALTLNDSCYSLQSSVHASQNLWRSDDGGVRWVQVSTLPFLAGDIVLAPSQNGSSPILYAHQQQPYTISIHATPTTPPQTIQGDPGIVVSTDGGHSWQHAPASGIAGPSSTALDPDAAAGPIGTLNDGSVIAVFPTDPSTFIFAAWKPGEKGWHALTPAIEQTNEILSFFPLAGANGKLTFWAITLSYDSKATNILRYDQQ